MKKLFVSVLAIASMVACMNEETVRVQDGNPIAFENTYVQNATRSNDPSTTTNNIQEFYVWAYMNAVDGVVFDNETVSRSGDDWTYNQIQYWLPGNNYYFAAFAGDRTAIETLPATMETNGLGVVKFTNVDGTNDILYSEAVVEDAAANQAPVALTFKHLLSKVKFTFKNGFQNDNNKVVVKDITMKVAETANVDLSAAADFANPESVLPWTNLAGTKTLEFGGVNKLDIGVSEAAENERLTIPADANYEYVIKFNVEVYNGSVLGLEKSMEVKLSGLELVAGRAYNLMATINQENLNLNKIEFEVEVDEWINQDVDGGAVEDEVTVLEAVVYTADEMAAALKNADANIINVKLAGDLDVAISSLGTMTGGSGEYKLGGENTKNITIDLNGNKLNLTTTYWSVLGAKNSDAIVTIKNGTMTSSQTTGTWNSYDLSFSNCNYAFEDVVFEKAIALEAANKSYNLKNVTINETHDYYAMWITAEGQNVTIDGLTVNSLGRGIKIDEQYVDAPAKVTLNIANATFKTENKAAILVKSVAGAEINVENINIANVAMDSEFAVWVDEDSAAYADLVVVNGALVKVEGANTQAIATDTELREALKAGNDVVLTEDITTTDADSNGYGATGININGGVFDGNGHTIVVEGATSTWDSAIAIKGGTIKNVTVAKGFRGIFFKNGTEKIVLENVIINGPTYTISCDSAGKQGFEAYNSKFYGWTSYAGTIGTGYFEGCTFGKGAGYNFSRPYAPTTYVNCDFEAGHAIDARAAVTFENCRFNGVALTADNIATLVTGNVQNVVEVK